MDLNKIKKCRICGSEDIRFDKQLQIIATKEIINYFICNSCGTIMDSATVTRDYEEVPLSNLQPSLKYYVEIGAGLFFIALQIQLMQSILKEKLGSVPAGIRYLDVGTGFGFSIHMAQQLGWEAIGVEPSAMGKAGSEMLGVKLVFSYLEKSNLPEQSFDIISFSEVIEHVQDPDVFIKTMAKYLAPGGFLLLTTPNADIASQGENAEMEWRDEYAVGDHFNIFSPHSINLVLARNAFDQVKIFFSEGSSGKKRMIILAAREQGVLPNDLDWSEVVFNTKIFLTNYLNNIVLVKESSNQKDNIYSGALFRLFELFVNAGNYEKAKEYIEKIDQLIQVTDLDEACLLKLQVNSFDEYVMKFPAYLGQYYFYKGIISLNYTKEYQEAIRYFKTSAHLWDIQGKIGHFTVAGRYARAKLHEGLSLLYSGNQQAAIQVFEPLLAQPKLLPADALETLYWNKGVAHLQIRDNNTALQYFAELILKKYPEYPKPALQMIMALNQSVEDLQNQIDSKLNRLAEINSKDIDSKLNRLAEVYDKDKAMLLQKVDKYEALVNQGIDKFNRLADRINRIAKVLDYLIETPSLIARKLLKPSGITISKDGSETTVGEVVSGRFIEQQIIFPKNNVFRISLKIGTFERLNTTNLYIDILDEAKNQVRHIAKSANFFGDNRLHTFSFEPIPDSQGKKYWLRISSSGISGNAVTLWCKRQSGNVRLIIDGKKSNKTLIYELGYTDASVTAAKKVKDILIITPDKLGKIRIGLGMRHWEIAKALASRGFQVTLATPHPIASDLKGEGFELYSALSQQKVLDVAQEHRFVMVQGDVLLRYPTLEASDKQIIVDMVTPFHIEDIEKGQKEFEHGYSVIRQCLMRGDFFVCGNESQRLYWLGMLTSLGRINKQIRDENAAFYSLIDVAGFGIADEPPVKSRQVLKGVFSNIKHDDFLLMWMGGIWDWLDPLTLIKGVHKAYQEDERIKLFFPAYRQSNGSPSLMAQKAKNLCLELDALDKSVFFNEYPVSYEDRGNYLLESDVGVVCQAANFETQISARTRVLDYIWAGLPILINEGDEWCELVRKQDLGLVVSGGSVDEWKDAILKLACDSDARNIKIANIQKVKTQYHWKKLVEPIVNYMTLRVDN